MKRKSFIISASAVAVGLPAAYYYKKHYWKSGNSIVIPAVLSNFCDENTLREIGTEYRRQVPEENNQQKLRDLIFTDASGKKIKTSDKSTIETFIANKNHEEFLKYNTTIIKGWIISQTEARQCALFSLT
jgi:hypothetical protein